MQVADDAGQLQHVHLPVPPVDATASTAACSARRRWSAPRASTRRTARCPSLQVELWQGFVFVNFDRDCAAAGADARVATSRSSQHYDLEQRRVPRHVHPHRPAVELEGDVRELQRRLPRQQAAPHHPGLLPERPRRVPRRRGTTTSNVIFRTNGYTHIDGGFNATTKALLPVFPKLTEEERWRSTFALHPADAVLRHRARSGVLLHRAPEDGRHDRRRDRLPVPSRARSSTRCSSTCSQMSDAGVQVFVRQDQDATTKVQRGMHSPLRGARPVLVAGGEPRAVQPLARPALPPALARSCEQLAPRHGGPMNATRSLVACRRTSGGCHTLTVSKTVVPRPPRSAASATS